MDTVGTDEHGTSGDDRAARLLHDLANQLSVIRGYAALLDGPPSDTPPGPADARGNILAAVERAAAVLAELHGAAATPTEPAPASPAAGASDALTVLLVEDEPSMRSVTRRLLERAGHAVLLAGGGDEALQVARDHAGRIDVVLTDVMLPGTRGPAVAEAVQQLRPEAGLLFMSGFPEASLRDSGSLPADAHLLEKPFTGEQLANKVQAARRPG